METIHALEAALLVVLQLWTVLSSSCLLYLAVRHRARLAHPSLVAANLLLQALLTALLDHSYHLSLLLGPHWRLGEAACRCVLVGRELAAALLPPTLVCMAWDCVLLSRDPRRYVRRMTGCSLCDKVIAPWLVAGLTALTITVTTVSLGLDDLNLCATWPRPSPFGYHFARGLALFLLPLSAVGVFAAASVYYVYRDRRGSSGGTLGSERSSGGNVGCEGSSGGTLESEGNGGRTGDSLGNSGGTLGSERNSVRTGGYEVTTGRTLGCQGKSGRTGDSLGTIGETLGCEGNIGGIEGPTGGTLGSKGNRGGTEDCEGSGGGTFAFEEGSGVIGNYEGTTGGTMDFEGGSGRGNGGIGGCEGTTGGTMDCEGGSGRGSGRIGGSEDSSIGDLPTSRRWVLTHCRPVWGLLGAWAVLATMGSVSAFLSPTGGTLRWFDQGGLEGVCRWAFRLFEAAIPLWWVLALPDTRGLIVTRLKEKPTKLMNPGVYTISSTL